jgi:hypothetical protein
MPRFLYSFVEQLFMGNILSFLKGKILAKGPCNVELNPS